MKKKIEHVFVFLKMKNKWIILIEPLPVRGKEH